MFKSGNNTGGWVVLLVGFFFTPLIGLLVGLAFKENKPEDAEKDKYFWCGICNIKYKEEFLGGETAHEGKICRSCLVKKQRGETNTFNGSQQPYPTAPISQPVNANIYQQPEYRQKNDSSSEKRILTRELSRKQRKRNSYLTQFIINLAVLQWLLPLIAVLIFWLQLKEQMKVQAMNNPSLGLATEIPFGKVIKDFFKILTSEFYVYGGHNISINLIWKIGIILAFLLPLGFWIYNLVRFLGLNGEINQLQAEIKEIEH
ncbi:hypothetical protein [endosymbiont GvMRE of Glomus versiforme]|uniref:hypothetical protein n=1 Tax=endosymbiont GvMRE of Glomus versiforme TaxID=2039283 RepID=UPI0011C34527|nr:hypothetical protein [endosymbiont GvMRE of Glomus versiforme]